MRFRIVNSRLNNIGKAQKELKTKFMSHKVYFLYIIKSMGLLHCKQTIAVNLLIMSNCQHGCPPLAEDDPHRAAMRSLFGVLLYTGDNSARTLQENGADLAAAADAIAQLELHDDIDYQVLAKLFLFVGTDMILSGAPAPMIITTLCILLYILDGKEEKGQTVLTGPDGQPDYLATASHRTSQQPNDLDSFRSVVRFFAKRIPCNCLDETKQDFHKREGMCNYSKCHRMVAPSKLRGCVACRKAAKYCSKDCQHADWPSRKESQGILHGG
jgi:hypothetical protein